MWSFLPGSEAVPPDTQFSMWTAFQPILGDPVLLVGMFLPFILVAALLFYRIRVMRRFTALTKQNARALDENVSRWQEAAARTEKMITLLTEIRDHMERIAPLPPGAPANEPAKDEYRGTSNS
jgi:hypothetical protein